MECHVDLCLIMSTKNNLSICKQYSIHLHPPYPPLHTPLPPQREAVVCSQYNTHIVSVRFISDLSNCLLCQHTLTGVHVSVCVSTSSLSAVCFDCVVLVFHLFPYFLHFPLCFFPRSFQKTSATLSAAGQSTAAAMGSAANKTGEAFNSAATSVK